MAIQLVNLGDINSGTGDSVRVAFQKVNNNFVEIYGNTAPTLFTYNALESIIGNHTSEFGSLVGSLPNSVNYTSLLESLIANTGTFRGYINSLGITAEYLNTGTSFSSAQMNSLLAIIASNTASLALKIENLRTEFDTANTSATANYINLIGLISSSTASIATKVESLETSFTSVNNQLVNINGSLTNVTTIVNTKANITDVAQAISNSTQSIATRVQGLQTDYTQLSGTLGNLQTVVSTKATIVDLENAVSNANGSIATVQNAMQTQYTNLASTVTSNYNNLITLVSNSTTSLASRINTLDTNFQSYQTAATASYTNLVSLVSNSTGSLATSVQGLQADFSNLSSTVTSNYNSLVQLVSNSATSLASKIDTLDTNFQSYQTAATASYTNLVSLVSNSTASLASSVQGLQTNYTNLASTVTANYNSLVQLVSNSATSLASSLDSLQTNFQNYQTAATASYTNLVTLISDSTSSVASQVNSLQTNFNNYQTSATASYTNLVTLISNSTASIASKVDTLQTDFNNYQTAATASYTNLVSLVSNSTGSIATQVNQLSTNFTDLATSVTNFNTYTEQVISISNSFTSVISAFTQLQADFNDLTTGTGATIEFVQSSVAASTASIATQLNTLQTNFTNYQTSATASYTNLLSVITNSTASIATRTSNLETSFTNLNSTVTNVNNSLTNVGNWINISSNAAITNLQTAISNSTGSLATSVNGLQTNYNGILGTLTNINNTLSNINTTLSTKASIAYVDTAVSNSTGSFASRVSSLETNFSLLSTSSGATISYVDTAVSNSTGSFATRVTNIETANSNQDNSITNINNTLGTKASISYVDTAVSNSTSSLASSVQTLTSQQNGMNATIQTQQSTINGLTATYSLTVNNNGAISGYKLNSTGGTSDFTVLADNFKLYTAGGTLTPFSVSGSTVNMQNVVITGSLITQGSVTTDKLLVTGRGAALNDDPYTSDLTAWSFSGASLVTDTSCPVGTSVIQTSSNTWGASRRMALDPNRNYQYRFWIRKTAGTAITYGMVQFFDSSGSIVYSATGWGSTGTYNYFGLVGADAPSTWTEYVISFGPNETAKIPNGAKTFAVGVIVNYSGSSGATTRVAGLRVFEKSQGDVIVDGTVTASKIDSRGLSIKDASGNIILAAGTALDHSNITANSGWLNSNISIGANGVLSGAGGGTVTAAGISAVHTNLSNAPDSILNSNVLVGGTNVLRNSGRFTSTTDWVDNGGGLQVDSSVTYGGFNTLKILGNGAYGIGTSVYRVESDTLYTISALVKGSSAISSSGYDSQLHIQNWRDEDPYNVHQEIPISADNSITTSWRIISQTFRTVASATAGYVRFYFYPLASGISVNVAWAKLEKGNKSTDWTPNPEEIKNTNISISGGTISGIGTGDGTAVANSNISIGANGVLSGAGGGTVTIGGLGYTGALDANRTYVDGSGAIQGVSSGGGTTVANNQITISSGQLNGIGTGAGTAVANSNITVDGNGAIQGIGTGAGTAVSNSRISVDSDGKIQGIGTGVGTAVSNTLVTTISLGTTNVTQSGNTVVKTGGPGSSWDAQAYSKESYTLGAFCSFRADSTGHYIMAGLNTDPTTDASYSSIDYAIYMLVGGQVRIYESGADIGAFSTYAVGDIFSVTYDGSNIRYYQNGTLLRSVAVTITSPLYFDSSLYYIGSSISQIKFGPMSSNAWGNITGQPAGIYNSNISIGANGVLYGAGGGNVTIGGLGYTGALDANRTYVDGSGNIQGVSSGAGTSVANSNISIGTNGVLYGAGGGTVTAAGISAVQTSLGNAPAGILNSNITITNGAINNIGSGGTYVSNNYVEGGVLHIARPLGAAVSVNASNVGGALQIRLPQGFSNTMLRFTVQIYEYTSGGTAQYNIGGYNYAGNATWYNAYANYSGPPGLARTVRFGSDGSGWCCVWIGETGGIWQYPQIRVVDFAAGYSNYEEWRWATGWGLSFVTGGINNVTTTITAPTPGGAMSGIDQINGGNASTYIANAAIGSAQIGSIAAASIQAGTISVGVRIQSTDGNFVIDFANKYISITI